MFVVSSPPICGGRRTIDPSNDGATAVIVAVMAVAPEGTPQLPWTRHDRDSGKCSGAGPPDPFS
jgi:hypothetical protein